MKKRTRSVKDARCKAKRARERNSIRVDERSGRSFDDL
jgi:hypothetical protein